MSFTTAILVVAAAIFSAYVLHNVMSFPFWFVMTLIVITHVIVVAKYDQ